MPQHFGVDVSSNNPHPINWPALFTYLKGRGGEKPFAIIKISQGTGYVNGDASGDIAAARAAGLVVGGYLMDQGNDSPAAEEAVFRANSQGVPQFDDDELPEGLSTGAYIAHLQSLVAQANVPQYLNQSEEDEGFPAGAGIWEANYNGQPGVTHRAGVLIHQFTSSGQVPGCAGEFDLNCWTGTEAQFAQFFGLGPLPGGGSMSDFPNTVAAELTAAGTGAWVVSSNGNVYTAGTGAPEYGTLATAGVTSVDNIVGIFRSWDGDGYYLLGADGAVYAFGDAAFHGSYPGLPATEREGDRSFGGGSFKLNFGGTGYKLVALDGSVYAFGS